jgi:hypothetical protein
MNTVSKQAKTQHWTDRGVKLAILVLAILVAVVMQSGAALAITTERVSVSSAGVQGNLSTSNVQSVSSDGRYVAFVSSASTLLPPFVDTNGAADIFVRDRLTSTTTRVSEKTGGGQATGTSLYPSITPDGRYVVFWSTAANLDPADTNGQSDVFVHDRTLNTTQLVSYGAGGVLGNSSSGPQSSISDDGRYVVFESSASNLVAGDTNGAADIFLRDRTLSTTMLVSQKVGGGPTNAPSTNGRISGDGSIIAFESAATNIIATDTNATADVFAYEVSSGTTARVSVDSMGGQANGQSGVPAINTDGRNVTFQSLATNLVAGDTNAATDVFVRNLPSGSTKRVSVSTAGAQATGSSQSSAISSDGRFIVYYSSAANLVAGDTNAANDVFLRDNLNNATLRVSVVDATGAQANDHSSWPDISDDGIWVAFNSNATNLVAGDTNAVSDIFAHDREDEDSDTVKDSIDNCPNVYNPTQDDGDGDGAGDLCDNCPATPNAGQANGDADQYGDACDNCPTVTNFDQYDFDADGIGNACDTEGPLGNTNGLAGADDCLDGVDNELDGLVDSTEPTCVDTDGDGIPDVSDNCVFVMNPGQANGDSDGLGDDCDNCPSVSNPLQENNDGDLLGNACDSEGPLGNTNGYAGLDDCLDVVDNDGDTLIDAPGEISCIDTDGDGDPDVQDNCPTVPNPSQTDIDGDGDGDDCDNCPATSNPAQTNSDADLLGDACDNCPTVYNPAQLNSDGDAFGHDCDNCPTFATPWAVPTGDTDCDGFPDTVTAGARGRENFIGTDPADRCADTTTANDETAPGMSPWPSDFNDNRATNISDVVMFGAAFNQVGPNPPNPLYNARFDLNASNSVNISDVVAIGPFFNKSCTP